MFRSAQESAFTYDPNAPLGDTDHDVLFREGRTAGGDVTYTPRLLLCDLKGALRHLPRSGGDLYGRAAAAGAAAVDPLCWDTDGQLEVLCDEPEPKSRYQHELDGTSEALPPTTAMAEQEEDTDGTVEKAEEHEADGAAGPSSGK